MTPTEFVVRTSTASMPNNCWGKYRHVAVLEVERGTVPTMISVRARGVARIVETWHNCNVGPIVARGGRGRCAYSKALDAAEALAEKLNDSK